jgi:hypothetical protein
MEPDAKPRFLPLLARMIEEDEQARGTPPTAGGTRFRNSDAGACARRLSFRAFGVPESNPMDQAGRFVTWFGRMVHHEWQRAAERYLADVAVEAELLFAGLEPTSGHADALIRLPDRLVMFELKTVNGFGYKLAVGVDSRHRHRTKPKGPKAQHLLQGALNAHAADADELVIGYLAMESLSKGLAKQIGVGEDGRQMAEWTFDRTAYRPWAAVELGRLRGIDRLVDQGLLAMPRTLDDNLATNLLNPNAGRLNWQCEYCPFLDVCRGVTGRHGQGPLAIETLTEELGVAR